MLEENRGGNAERSEKLEECRDNGARVLVMVALSVDTVAWEAFCTPPSSAEKYITPLLKSQYS